MIDPAPLMRILGLPMLLLSMLFSMLLFLLALETLTLPLLAPRFPPNKLCMPRASAPTAPALLSLVLITELDILDVTSLELPLLDFS